ncbi:heterogeneous nuclear ribonucleoprotein Q-like isoform X4 [Telopea speciosissima]|uniref:heterogeneous nuclear ribonucleoprotein Q-like isoform X4 n=1 Tax=Telopea speciosissima TaxID=54955 RepID=UPI001CC5890A|nr:heterogeneous nuclear ribonucleoprotein Q-like isoform X4 [Telopea speciosissima]
MPPRASNKKGSPAAKRGPRGKKATATSPLGIVSDENKASESEVQLGVVKETKIVEVEEKEVSQEESDEGAKHDVAKEETAAAEVEDTKGSSEVEVSKGGREVDDSKVGGEVEDTERGGDGANNADANETASKDEEADKSGSDEEDNEEEEDPSVYMEAPLTDRKKEKEFEIFVGGLDKEAVEEDLIKIFGEFGEIQSARIVKHQTTQKSKGFAFIRYVTAEQAKKVLVELKDGIEVRGKRVGISPSQDNDTLYMGNICKTWTKEQVLETLKSLGIEQIEEIYLPNDPKNEGKSRGFALLELSTHSDAMAAFQRLRKPDAVFGCDRSAKVAFAQSSIRPSEEALSQVKTVFIEGLTDSWDEEKVKELCKQYGEIEKVQLSRNLGKKWKDFGFVTFTSRESAVACVEGINNAQVVEGDVKVKANLAKPQNKGRLAKQGARGGFKVEEGEKTEETGPSKMKGNAKSKGGGGKGKKTLPKLKNAKGGKPSKTQGSLDRSQGSGVPSRSERTNQQRNRQPPKGEKRGRRDMDTGYNDRSSKKARNMHGRPPNNSFGSRRNKPQSGKPRPNYGAASTTYGNTYAQGYAASSSRYQGQLYGAASGSKRPYSDMEPHAGYLEPAANKQSRDAYGYGMRRPAGYDVQGSSGTAFGGGNAAFGGVAPGSVVQPYVHNYANYGGYEQGGRTSGSYVYPSSAAYPPRRAYY